MRKAVIDVGSNSLLLTVAEASPDGPRFVFESTRVTALGEGAKATGVLSEPAMERSLSALAELSLLAKEHRASEIRAAATMAVRIAKNQAEFVRRADAQGTPIEVLPGDREAELGFLAVAADPIFSSSDRITVIDPGGNSTELSTSVREGEGWRSLFRKSFPVGTLGLRDGVLAGESLDPPALLRGVAEIDRTIGLEFRPHRTGTVVTIGATGTNLVSLREAKAQWDPERVHGAVLSYEEVSRAVEWLSPMADAERAALVGLEKGREKTIHLGALILERFLYAVRAEQVSVSVRGWRHALLTQMLNP